MRGAPHWSLALALCLVATSAVLARDGEKCFHKRHKRPGTCRPLSSCPSVSAELIKHAGSAQNCARKGSSAVTVCCPSREEVAVPLAGWDDEPPPEDTSGQLPCHRVLAMGDSQDKIRGPPGTIARTMCQRYNRFVCSKKSQTAIEESFGGSNVIDYCESHNKTDQLIVGGRPARPKEYPHMALLGLVTKPGVSFDCGGSIISPRFILTAAHCLFREREPVKWVLVGAKSRTEKPHTGGRPQLIGISERISHPDYKPPVKYNDIALLRLKEDISFDEGFARPACIHTEPGIERRESSATVTGWGLTEWDGDQSALLMTVTLNLTTPRSCQKSYEPSTGTPRGIIGTQICAGSRGKDSCQGDSGGPLQLLPNDPYCMFHIIGVVSFGAFCGFQFPGVYTRVAPFVPWIEGIVWPQN